MIPVNSSRGRYSIYFHHSIEENLELLCHYLRGATVVIFSNDTVFGLYGDTIQQKLQEVAMVYTHCIPDGEEHKNLQTYVQSIISIDKFPLDRNSVILALGGGVVGDIAGFVASTLLRGIRWVQMPTTVLSMVDSSIGGKTAVNLPSAKNRLGSIYPPDLVLSNLEFVQTLPKEEIRAGFGEILKHAILADAALFAILETHIERLLGFVEKATNPELRDIFIDVLRRSCVIKARIVEVDEKEEGIRKILNFGHTIGHALEKVCMETGQLLRHGDAVSLGMVLELALLHEKGLVSFSVYQKVCFLVKRLDMSIYISNIGIERVCALLVLDKKVDLASTSLSMTHIPEIGKAQILSIAVSEIQEFLRQHLTHNFMENFVKTEYTNK